ncbi:unnamed protein product, partial [Pylaiella littoralis]
VVVAQWLEHSAVRRETGAHYPPSALYEHTLIGVVRLAQPSLRVCVLVFCLEPLRSVEFLSSCPETRNYPKYLFSFHLHDISNTMADDSHVIKEATIHGGAAGEPDR